MTVDKAEGVADRNAKVLHWNGTNTGTFLEKGGPCARRQGHASHSRATDVKQPQVDPGARINP